MTNIVYQIIKRNEASGGMGGSFEVTGCCFECCLWLFRVLSINQTKINLVNQPQPVCGLLQQEDEPGSSRTDQFETDFQGSPCALGLGPSKFSAVRHTGRLCKRTRLRPPAATGHRNFVATVRLYQGTVSVHEFFRQNSYWRSLGQSDGSGCSGLVQVV